MHNKYTHCHTVIGKFCWTYNTIAAVTLILLSLIAATIK